MTNTHTIGGNAEIAELRTRVYGVEAGLQRIEGLIATLSVKFDTQSRTPWGIIFSGIGLMGGALVGYINIQLQPIDRELDRTTAVIEKLSDRFMPATEIDRKFNDFAGSVDKHFDIASARRDEWQRMSEGRSEENRTAIQKLQDSVVPRGEHEEHWRAVDQRFVDVQRQIDDTKRTLNDLYTARDVIKDDNERIRVLEERLLGPGRPPSP